MDIMKTIKECGIVPVVVLQDAKDAVPAAHALLKGGINVMEITFRTDAAKEAIENVAKNVPEMLVGAGTVITSEQMHNADEAGAQFFVSPGLDLSLVDLAKELNKPILPGIITPSEIMAGLSKGISTFKFFPSGTFGGLKTISALSGPFPQISFLPTGGINAENAEEYFCNTKIIAIGGSWMITDGMIKDGNYEEISARSTEVREIFKKVRQ